MKWDATHVCGQGMRAAPHGIHTHTLRRGTQAHTTTCTQAHTEAHTHIHTHVNIMIMQSLMLLSRPNANIHILGQMNMAGQDITRAKYPHDTMPTMAWLPWHAAYIVPRT